MRTDLLLLLGAIAAVTGIVGMEIGERTLTAGVFSLLSVVVVFVYRRFRGSTGEIPLVFQVASAIGVTLGVLTMIGGALHSAAVTAVASFGFI